MKIPRLEASRNLSNVVLTICQWVLYDILRKLVTLEISIQTSLQENILTFRHELYHLKVSVLEEVLDHGRSLLEVRESKYD